MSKIRGFWAYSILQFRRRRRGSSFWGILRFIGILLAVTAAAISPYMRRKGMFWSQPWSWWSAIYEGGYMVVAASLFMRFEKGFAGAFRRRGPNHEYQVRMADLAGIVDRAKTLDLRRTADVQRFREDVLKCIVSGLAEQLDLDRTKLTVNLLSYEQNSPPSMLVEARSDPLRPLGRRYATTDELLPWRAILSGAIEVYNDFRPDTEHGERPYRSVVAIPVTKGEVAYGSLSIDYTDGYAFYGRRRLIYCQCRPYIALLSLTYGEGASYYGCRFSPPHSD